MKKNLLLTVDLSVIDSKYKEILAKNNYNTFLKRKNSEIIKTIEVEKINIIILDLESKDYDGIEFLKYLKTNSEYKDIYVLVLILPENLEKYKSILKYININILKKPFCLDELLLKCDIFINQLNYQKQLLIKNKELDEYKKVLNKSDIVSKSDKKGRITYVNQKFKDISGFTKEELLGKPHNIVRHPDTPKEVFKEMWDTISNKKTFKGTIKNKRKDGTSYYVDATITPILDLDGNIQEYIGVRHDITDIMNPKKQLLDDIKSSISPITILGKIDNYLLLKEFYGENFTQKVEDYISKNIVTMIPVESPLNKVYQLGNGEFGFLRECAGNSAANIEMCLKKFRNNIEFNDFVIEDKKVDIEFVFAYTMQKQDAFENLSIGITQCSKDKVDILLADNLAKEQQVKAKENMKIVNILKSALHNKDDAKIISYFQPIVNNETNEIEKYESLVRLIDFEGNMISPFFFLDIAKKAGYYKDITNAVIDNTQKALDSTDKEVSINLSTLDIEDLDIRNKLLDFISKPQNYGRIIFELLEDEVAHDFDVVKDFIGLAKVIGGVKIAIDDFGSGYSNFERLVHFQPDILKIDGSLIKNIVDDTFTKHVVDAIILFAKQENIKLVAEFIANEDILNAVKKLNIEYSQGFHTGKPQKL